VLLLLYIGDDFPNVHALLEAVFALEEEVNHPARPTENSQGNTYIHTYIHTLLWVTLFPNGLLSCWPEWKTRIY